MNSLFLALDWFGLAQDFLALAAGLLAQHCRRVSHFTQTPSDLACWAQTDRRGGPV